MHITILAPGFGYASTLIGPYEVFTSAGVLWDLLQGEAAEARFEVIMASEDGQPVTYDGGISIQPKTSVRSVRRTDLIFVPSIGLDLERVFNSNPRMLKFLQQEAAKGTLIAGVCTGVAMLAEAGLLNDRPATTHWALAEEYKVRYPKVNWKAELFITESDNLFCGGGVYASLDLCLYLVERLAGYEVAKQCGRALLINAPRTWQASFSTPLINQRHQDQKIRQIQEYMEENFSTSFTVDEVAQHAGMSTRNFTRRFKQATGEAPLNYLHKLRVNCAKTLLETDFISVQQVCFDVGYEDAPFFRRIFKRYTGLTPSDYKQRFGRPGRMEAGG
ncbi:GlxA family transcriptional regulator [Marinobacterium sedimentorum]|uniref:GlxA family transcriptional regulator n=1 Tax=Marinobacterium sedimentorum TaxID=2927804 RepID=UPI0020C72060|nr:helix-turn-helix domain-containing protein [Marinobacterium sedimentorum]MCP8686542.1 AraC family transcriptional regulator [Marinobacterium sedimentorum]